MEWTISHANGRFYISADLRDQESVRDFITILSAISDVIGDRASREMIALAPQYEAAMSAALEHGPSTPAATQATE